jgi:hypothetical protein
MEALPVDTPASTVQTKLPSTDLATLTVGDGKVSIWKETSEIRTLELMAKYGETFLMQIKQCFDGWFWCSND